MIQTVIVTILGKQFQRTWSDAGFLIERDGAQYSEAVDPLNSGRLYEETDEEIETEKQNVPELGYLTIKE